MAMRIPAVWFPEEDIAAIQERAGEILRGGQLTLGPYTEGLEKEAAQITGRQFAIAVNSGTAALEIILRSLNIGPGASVILPTNTFPATAFAIIHAGAKPIFVDIADDLMLDPAELGVKVAPDTKAVIAVHIGGALSANLEPIINFCRKRNLHLIEDAAHALGGSLDNRPAGAWGEAAAFSLYPTKVVTSGEGGLIVTNNPIINERAKQLRDQGKESFFSAKTVAIGYNWRLSELNALVGLYHIKRLPEFIAKRTAIAKTYDAVLGVKNNSGLSNYYKYVVQLTAANQGRRQEIKDRLRADLGINLSGEVYAIPCHNQPAFREFSNGPLPKAELLCANHICLPMSSAMSEAQAQEVARALKVVLL